MLISQAERRPRTVLQRIFGADPLAAGNRSWYKGALGEIAVGQLLGGIGPEWTVLHSVPVGAGSSDIDHVLIGPAGVYTINTKNHGGQSVWVAGRTLMVAGKKQRHLYNTAHEATRAAILLGRQVDGTVPVTGIVAIRGATTLTIKEQPVGAVVLADHQLLRWLRSQPATLNPGQIQRLAAVARHPRTWHRSPFPTTDPSILRRQFTALQNTVNNAKAIRGAWAVVALLAIPMLMLVSFR
ncbi:nuclease-related domain-containing protein [Paenarthrobacter ureafaciens]|uniref:nuclease-related domain-containing protein n=1 Tax=Paenarthrobacter ureafaciens TaxID=37931 RepID=UPI00398A7C35